MQDTAQALPEKKPRDRGYDIEGQVFGELTALHVVGTNAKGNVWLLRCSCGRFAQRSVSALHSSIKNGHTPMCHECRDELYRGLILDRRDHWQSVRGSNFYKYGSLWSPAHLARLQAEIRREVQKTLGVWPDERPTSDVEEEEDEDPGDTVDGSPAWDEGFKKPPSSILPALWGDETHEERETRLLADKARVERLAREAEAAKIVQVQARQQKKEEERREADAELSRFREASREVIQEDMAARAYSAARLAKKEEEQSKKSTLPACFGVHYSAKEPDCVGSTKLGKHKPSCDLRTACRIRKAASKSMPSCFGQSFSASAPECLGGPDVPECGAWKKCRDASQPYLVQLTGKSGDKKEEGDDNASTNLARQ